MTAKSRRNRVITRNRGELRREALRQSALTLLETRTPDQISFKNIADQAQIPVASAYHFYANTTDLFIDIVPILGDRFVEASSQPISGADSMHWSDIIGTLIDRAETVYQTYPATKNLLLSQHTPIGVRSADRITDSRVAEVMQAQLSRYQPLPDGTDLREQFYYVTEIGDLVWGLSILRHGDITPQSTREFKVMAIGYLRMYLPEILPTPAAEQHTTNRQDT